MGDARDELARELADGPNIAKVGDVLYRAEMRPDGDMIENLRDHGDCWGDTGWTRDGEYGPIRPEWATGRAEILFSDHRQSMWWEPPTDVVVGSDLHREVRRNVRDLLEYGFSYVRVEVCEGTDAYGQPIVRDVASLSGIEPFTDDDYLRSIVRDLLDELGEPAAA